MKSILRVKCDFCKKWVYIHGKCKALGFVLQTGKTINACIDCICRMGNFVENGDDEAIEEMYRYAGITEEDRRR